VGYVGGDSLSAAEYRKRVYKVVTAPSGFSFTIRKMSFKVFSKLLQIYGETPTTELTAEQRAKLGERLRNQLPQIMEVVIPGCVVKPKIVLENPTEDELALDDIEPNDLIFLMNEITNFSGLTGPAAEERSSFQQ